MIRQPGGDTAPSSTWQVVLAHRPREERDAIAARLEGCGLDPEQVRRALCDGGDELYAAARGGDPRWTEAFGGAQAAAMLAAEVSALAAHLNSRSAIVRAYAVEALLDDYSAVAVAAGLGISRQKVYDIARAAQRDTEYINQVPWRTE